MLLPDLDYFRPDSLDETLALIDEFVERGEGFQIYSGGTDVIPKLKRGGYVTKRLVSIGHLEELRGIAFADRVLRIGAATPLAEIVSSGVIAEHAPWLAAALRQVASPQIRNRATLGGNILVDNRCHIFDQSDLQRGSHSGCYKAGGESCQLVPRATRESTPVCRARFVSDGAAVLSVGGASLHFRAGEAHRSASIRDFYLRDGLDREKLEAGSVLTHIELRGCDQLDVGYEKLRVRNAMDFPSLGVAMARGYADGKAVCVCLTGVDTHPVFLEVAIDSFGSDEAMLEALSVWARGSITPMAQDILPPSYRREMAAVFIRRLWRRERD